MGLVPLGALRVGFWVTEASQDALAELPRTVVPVVDGIATEDSRALVLCAIDARDTPVWAYVSHAGAGAALVIPFDGKLVVGLGSMLAALDERGSVTFRYVTEGQEITAAATCDGALLVLSRGAAAMLEVSGKVRWRRALAGASHLVLGTEGGMIRLASGDAEAWQETALSALDGGIVGADGTNR